MTVRQGLELIATCLGGFATEDNDGNFVLSKFYVPEIAQVPISFEEGRSLEPTVVRGVYTAQGITVTVSEDEIYTTGDDANIIIDNPYFTESMWSTLQENLLGLSFAVTEAPITMGDFRPEPWDSVGFSTNDEDIAIPCLGIAYMFDGGLSMTISSNAQIDDPAEKGGPVSQSLATLKSQVADSNAYAQELEGRITSASDAIESLDSTVEGIGSDVEDLNSSVDSFVQTIEVDPDPDDPHISVHTPTAEDSYVRIEPGAIVMVSKGEVIARLYTDELKDIISAMEVGDCAVQNLYFRTDDFSNGMLGFVARENGHLSLKRLIE